MWFGELPVGGAEGTLLAHSIRAGDASFKKGRRLSASDLERLKAADVERVTVVRLEPGDVHEDEAAARVAEALGPAGLSASAPFTGRVNLFAEAPGLLAVDRELVDRINRVDPAITIATLPPYARLEAGLMVATIKIIPFSAPQPALAEVERMTAEAETRALAAHPFRPLKVALIQTRSSATPEKVLDKTERITEGRVAALGGTLVHRDRCAHEATALADAIRAAAPSGYDLLLVNGASAITDTHDIIPAAIEAAGGRALHFGMPVDPGNLILLAETGEAKPALGLPGCARSPKMNGIDWVLERIAAGLDVTPDSIMGMGVGGLLADTPARPQPRSTARRAQDEARDGAKRAPRIAAVVLAAGQSRRMGQTNKLLATVEGKTLLARVADAATASRASPVIVVTGHEAEAVKAAVELRPVRIVHNRDYADGLSASLKVGLGSIPEDCDGALVLLADMPFVTAREIDRLIAAYDPVEGRSIVVPTRGGKRGNPVLWDRRFFEDMSKVTGDTGAKHLIGEHDDVTVEVEMASTHVLTDIDTPEALEALGGSLPSTQSAH